ncbi:MAG: hypothetical protein AAF224_13010 [Pseudomonadota bacterium]
MAIHNPVLLTFCLLIAFVGAAAASLAITDRLISARLLLDRPNERSSHERETPRSGGVAVFAAWAAAMIFCSLIYAPAGGLSVGGNGGVSPDEFIALAMTGLLAFALGLVDDHSNLAARRKLIYQVAAAALFVLMFGAITAVPLPFFGSVALGLFGPVLTVFWIVAFMNAFNFMDGLNGIAGLSAIVVAVALALAAALAGALVWAVAAGVLAAAIAGFAWRNYPSGAIFLGDSGSLFISYAIAGLAVLAARAGAPAGQGDGLTILFVPIAFMPFLFDVAFTLAHRAWRKRPLTEAHRDHLYQLLSRDGVPATVVTGLYAALVAVSCVTAFAADAMPADRQWIAPLLLAIAMMGPAIFIYRRALARGLLIDRPHSEKPRRQRRRAHTVGDDAPLPTGSLYKGAESDVNAGVQAAE